MRTPRRFHGNESGSVAVIGAVMIALALAVVSLLVDLSILYVAKQRSQIVADVANLAATNTTEAISGRAATPAAVATAAKVAEINGYGGATVTTTAVASPLGDGSTVLRTRIDEAVEPGVGLLTNANSLPVASSSWSSSRISGDCLTALIADVTILNQVKLSGPDCTVRAKTDLYTCWSVEMAVAAVHVGWSKSWEANMICSNAQVTPSLGSFVFSDTITDTYASDSRLSALKNTLASMVANWGYGLLPPVNPFPPISFTDKTYSGSTASLARGAYGKLTMASSKLTLNGYGAADPSCSAPTTFYGAVTLTGTNTLTFNAGCYVFGGAVTIKSGGRASFAVTAGAGVVFVFKGGLFNETGSFTSFGNANYHFNYATVDNASGASLSFGDGTYSFWGGSVTNAASTSTLTFGDGPVYNYTGGFYNYGTMTFGNGSRYLAGTTISLTGSSITSFGTGNFYFYTGTFSALGEAVTLGAGGSSSTGSGTFYMQSGTFLLGPTKFTSIGMTFGFYLGSQTINDATLNAVAPTGVNPSRGYRDILFAAFTSGVNIYQYSGQHNVVSGMIYTPLGFSSITGNSTTEVADDGCFQIAAGNVGINTGASVELAPCRGFVGTSSTAGKLLQ